MNKLKEKLKSMKGITLVALIITIIVLLILAGVVINMTVGNDGIINKAQGAVDMYKNATEKEEYALAKVTEMINGDRSITEENLIEVIQREIKKINEEKNTVIQLVPAGTVISYMGNNAPKGYLKCNGDEYNIADYPNLANQIETEFGAKNHFGGDGETTFKVPNLQGEFLRGAGENGHTGQGSGATVSTHQNATSFPTYYVNDNSSIGVPHNGNIYASDQDTTSGSGTTYYHDPENTRGIYGNLTLRFTSRPTNTSVLYCIKY